MSNDYSNIDAELSASDGASSTPTPAPSPAPNAQPAAGIREANGPSAPAGDAGSRESSPHYQAVRDLFERSRQDMLSADGAVSVPARKAFKEANEWLYGNGALPAGIADTPAPNRVLGDSDLPAERVAYQPAVSPNEYHLAGLDPMAGRETVAGVRDVFSTLGLSREDGKLMWSEIQRLENERFGPDDDAALDAILMRVWPGDQFEANLDLAAKAFQRLPQNVRDYALQTGISYSPWIYQILARAERSRQQRGGK